MKDVMQQKCLGCWLGLPVYSVGNPERMKEGGRRGEEMRFCSGQRMSALRTFSFFFFF